MAGSIVAINNLLDGATVTASGTATGSAVANLYAYRPSKTWTDSATTAGRRINVDFGSAFSCDYMAIHNHNLPTAGTYKVQSHTSAPPASGAWAGATTRATFTAQADDMFVSFGSASARYWSLYLEDSDGAAGAFSSAPSIGELSLAASGQLNRPFSYGGNFVIDHRQILHETPWGVSWQAKASEVRSYAVSYQDQSDADLALIKSLFSTVAGKPFSIALDPDNPTAAKAAVCEFVRLAPVLSWSDDLNHGDITLEYTTLPTGITLT